MLTMYLFITLQQPMNLVNETYSIYLIYLTTDAKSALAGTSRCYSHFYTSVTYMTAIYVRGSVAQR